jgi:NAD(P)-dependent dehydrogenase (short-subunit alcohol dehydrogenase family)
VDWAVAALGGLDGLIYATGASPLKRLAEMNADEWVDLLRTNVVGAALITAAAVRHLERTSGRAVFLSSNSVPTPLPGLGAYASSKAGLEAMVRAWAAEHPTVSFETYVVGPTVTGFADGWDPHVLGEILPSWEGVLDRSDMRQPEDVAREVVNVLAGGSVPAQSGL